MASRPSSNSASRAGSRIWVSYTRSRLMDDASSVFDVSILTGPVANYPVADSFDRGRERDYSTGDIPHVFVASSVWQPPWGSGRQSSVPGVIGALANDWSLAAVAEVFNLLNTPPLGNPNGVAGSAAFGTITAAGDPRVVQLAVRLLF
jgi:hypothetical protein